jgi:asparagine synthase (glutamine-hydrolysing)
LKELLYRLVPRELVDRPKSGFGLPIEEWLRGNLRAWTESELLESRALEAVGCDGGAVRRVWDRFVRGEARLAGGVWLLLMLSAWHGRHAERAEERQRGV